MHPGVYKSERTRFRGFGFVARRNPWVEERTTLEQAGNPHELSTHAEPSYGPNYTGYYVGGGASMFCGPGFGHRPKEGTWGWDYECLGWKRRVHLLFSRAPLPGRRGPVRARPALRDHQRLRDPLRRAAPPAARPRRGRGRVNRSGAGERSPGRGRSLDDDGPSPFLLDAGRPDRAGRRWDPIMKMRRSLTIAGLCLAAVGPAAGQEPWPSRHDPGSRCRCRSRPGSRSAGRRRSRSPPGPMAGPGAGSSTTPRPGRPRRAGRLLVGRGPVPRHQAARRRPDPRPRPQADPRPGWRPRHPPTAMSPAGRPRRPGSHRRPSNPASS